MDRVRAALAWIYRQRKLVRRWAVRIVSFYFGFKILHHEIYDVDSPEALVIALGLWLCGIAPADMFDGLRKLGDVGKDGVEKAVGVNEPTVERESASGDKR
jgi:hypothetical protein